jgi:hypothetical protein
MKYSYKYLENEWTRGYLNFVQTNIDKDWFWEFVSLNINITWDIIKNNPDKEWWCVDLSEHPNITWDII